MIRLLRRAIYKMGFRPKPGSILYSPSLAFIPSNHKLRKDPLFRLLVAVNEQLNKENERLTKEIENLSKGNDQ